MVLIPALLITTGPRWNIPSPSRAMVVGSEGVVAAPGSGINDVLEGNVLLVGLEMLLA